MKNQKSFPRLRLNKTAIKPKKNKVVAVWLKQNDI